MIFSKNIDLSSCKSERDLADKIQNYINEMQELLEQNNSSIQKRIKNLEEAN